MALLTDLVWRRSDLPLARKSYWNGYPVLHPWYDPRLYKKQLTNNNDPEVDDEPYIVLPPDNTINTKDEAFKLDEETATTLNSEKVTSPKPTTDAPPTTLTTTQPPITTPLTTPTILPPITTPIPITPPTTLPTTLPPPPTTPTTLPPPPTTKPTEKTQVIAIQAATPFIKRTFPTSAANINLNLEIGDNEQTSQAEQHQSVPVAPTAQSIYNLNQQEVSTEQPTPQIIYAPMPAGSDASQNQQPQIIMAQPAQTPPPEQYVFAPQPTAQPQPQPQYEVAAPQPVKTQPQYVMAAPQQPQQQTPAPIIIAAPTPPQRPAVYQPVPVPAPAPVPTPVSQIYLSQMSPPRTIIAAPSSPVVAPLNAPATQPQVTVSASPPASITVNSPESVSPMGDLGSMMMSPSVMGMSSVNPFLMNKLAPQVGPMYPMGMSSLQLPIFQTPQFRMNSGWPPLGQQLAQQYPSSPMLSSPLLSSIPQGYDPLLYNGLTGLFANAIRSSMIQPQPNALASALALAAGQAQARNQPPDLLTAALTQALAQNIQQGIQPISNTKLVQALSQALSQVQPATTPGTSTPVYPPQPPQQPQQQPLPPPQQQQQQQPPPRETPQPAPYSPIQIPPYQVVPNNQQQAPPIRDSRSDTINKNYSVNKVGKALASALLKAARKIASRNPRLNTQRRKESRYRHHSRSSGHYRERSFVPLQHLHSPDLNYQTLNRENTLWTDKDIQKYFTMFRSFWANISSPCSLHGCYIFRRCPG